MARNLGGTSCVFCPGDVVLIEPARPVLAVEVGVYWGEFRGMLVARAECYACLAPYLAWVRSADGHDSAQPRPFYDLSHYHSFNDEPDERDLPRYEVEEQLVRTRLYSGDLRASAYCNLGVVTKPKASP